MSRKKYKKKSLNKKIIIIIILFVILIIGGILFYTKYQTNLKQKNFEKSILSHYNKFVVTTKETPLYQLSDNLYKEVGTIGNNQELILEEETKLDEYFKTTINEKTYYLYYDSVKKIDNILEDNQKRYKKYIPFNENVATNDKTNLYDTDNILVYTLNESMNLPIIVKDNERYGVIYNDRLLYINKSDEPSINPSENTTEKNTSGIAVFNYHFFYDETEESERQDCNQIICQSKSQFESHLEYIKENNIFTPTMSEFEMYLDGKINLPKSVLLTIDDGWRTAIGEELLEKYQLNGTIFLITSWFSEIDFLDKYQYIEYHSHGDDLHTQGICPGGQGGAIKCLAKDKLLADLALSRKKLGGTTVFCYPFYEYNSYSISVLKEAGFTMSFRGGFQKARPGVNKFEIPRYVIYSNTNIEEIQNYIN